MGGVIGYGATNKLSSSPQTQEASPLSMQYRQRQTYFLTALAGISSSSSLESKYSKYNVIQKIKCFYLAKTNCSLIEVSRQFFLDIHNRNEKASTEQVKADI